MKGNPNYEIYKNGVGIITTRLNLMELHYGVLLAKGRKAADEYYGEFEQFAIEFDSETIKNASEFRALHKKKKLSYIDCIGYTIARMHGTAFLTGDRQFAGMDNVEYVK